MKKPGTAVGEAESQKNGRSLRYIPDGMGHGIGPFFSRPAVRIGEHKAIVMGSRDASSEGLFFSGLCFLVVDNDKCFGVVALLLFKPKPSAIGRPIVHNDPLGVPVGWENLSSPKGPDGLEMVEIVVHAKKQTHRFVTGTLIAIVVWTVLPSPRRA